MELKKVPSPPLHLPPRLFFLTASGGEASCSSGGQRVEDFHDPPQVRYPPPYSQDYISPERKKSLENLKADYGCLQQPLTNYIDGEAIPDYFEKNNQILGYVQYINVQNYINSLKSQEITENPGLLDNLENINLPGYQFKEKFNYSLSYLYLSEKVGAVVNDAFSIPFFAPSSYLSFLDFLGFDPEEAQVFPETIQYHFFQCETGNHFFYFPSVAAGKLNPWHWNNSLRVIASKVRKNIMASKAENVLFWDLTFPKKISLLSLFIPKRVELLCWKTLSIFRKKLEKVLGGMVGGRANYHPYRSAIPLEPHSHFHTILLDYIKKPLKECPYKKYQRKISRLLHKKEKECLGDYCPYVLHGKVCDNCDNVCDKEKGSYYEKIPHVFSKEKVQELWFEALKEVFPSWLLTDKNNNLLTPNQIDVYLKYVPLMWENKAKIQHRVKYMQRRPLVDLLNFYNENVFVPEQLSEKTTFLKYLVKYKNHSKVFGFWRKLKYFQDSDLLKEELSICPICSSNMFYTYSFLELPQEAGLLILGRNASYLFERKDPPP